MADIRYPEGSYKGREILSQSGVSFVELLAGRRTAIHDASTTFGWEIFKRRAVRKGDWKALWLEPPFGKGRWQLFNLRVDPGETRDLAQLEPQKLAEMMAAWETYAAENNVIISNGPLRFP